MVLWVFQSKTICNLCLTLSTFGIAIALAVMIANVRTTKGLPTLIPSTEISADVVCGLVFCLVVVPLWVKDENLGMIGTVSS